MNNLNLENLTEQEREAVLKILTEITQTGTSSTYQDLLYADYKEIPTDIITFIKNDKYLGRAWHLSNGECKLYPYWENKLKELFPDNLTTRYNNFIESGARGLGKAQPLDSLVFTEFGYRKMRDLKVGDLIYGSDGKLHKITHIFPQGIKPTMKVTFSDKTSTLCAEDHLWSYYKIYSKDKTKLYTATCKELYESGVISVSSKTGYKSSKYKIPLVSPIAFQHKDTLISPYMMGLLLGDSHFGKSSIDTSTTDYVEYIKQLGLYQKRSWEKFIPKDYLYNDVNSRIELLQGLMDTDGEIGTDYQEKYSTVSKQLAEDIVFLVQSLGGTARITYKTNRTYKYKGQIRSCRDYYDINIKLPKNILPCKLDRKLNNLNPNKLAPIRTIRNIEYVEPQECQCIIIDSEDHLYLTNDLICTHNSEIAITCILYLMHRLMCLKDPYLFLNLKPTEKVAFAFMNITENLSYEIGVTKFQNTVQCSPWFMERGTITGRKDLVWNPPEWIDVIVGSQPRHVIGKPIFGCLDGDTEILTTEGTFKIKNLVDKQISVLSKSNNGNIIVSDTCTVKPTKTSYIEYQIEMEDGSIIKCTPEHKFLLTTGEYKEAQYLTDKDEIMDFKPFGYIYKCIHPITKKIYIGKREKSSVDKSYYGSGKLWKEAIKNIKLKDIQREILAWGTTRTELNKLEKYFINLYNAQNPEVGYNIHKGGQGGNPLNNSEAWSQLHLGKRNGRYGKPVSLETRQKISNANKGKIRSDSFKEYISKKLTGVPKPEGFGEKVSQALKGKPHVISSEGLEKIKQGNIKRNTGTHIYNNGVREIRLREDELIPSGFVKGRIIKGKKTGKNNVKGRKWYTDGQTEIYIIGTPPNGFIQGRSPKVKQNIRNKKVK